MAAASTVDLHDDWRRTFTAADERLCDFPKRPIRKQRECSKTAALQQLEISLADHFRILLKDPRRNLESHIALWASARISRLAWLKRSQVRKALRIHCSLL